MMGTEHETVSEYERFATAVERVMSVPKTEMLRREAEYKKQADLNPRKRGPKRKIKPSASNPVDCGEPLVQPDSRIFHGCADLDAELRLRMPVLALPHTARCDEADILRSTRRADDAVLPLGAVLFLRSRQLHELPRGDFPVNA